MTRSERGQFPQRTLVWVLRYNIDRAMRAGTPDVAERYHMRIETIIKGTPLSAHVTHNLGKRRTTYLARLGIEALARARAPLPTRYDASHSLAADAIVDSILEATTDG